MRSENESRGRAESMAEAKRHKDFGFHALIGRSKALRGAVDLSRRVARTRMTVLLVGETGTGKELFARAIHYASPNAGQPFVAINCAAIPENLLESELFGHEKGAFTGAHGQKRGLMELAGSGTVFLDEIAELPGSLQAKFLRVLEERRIRRLGGLEEIPIHCRVVAATNRLLEDAVADGEFREDLFYRLNVFRVILPPLRERDGDLELLARHFLEELARSQGTEAKTLSPEAAAALRSHGWPGNLRELKNVIERAAILSDGPVIGMEHLMIQHRVSLPAAERARGVAIRIPNGGRSLAEIEREAVRLTLEMTRGNKSAAARILGISRPTLARKIQQYGLRRRKAAVEA